MTKKQYQYKMLLQKIIGLFFIFLATIVPMIDGDATVSLIFAPFGLYALCTRHLIIY